MTTTHTSINGRWASRALVGSLSFAMFLAACGAPATTAPTSAPDAAATAAPDAAATTSPAPTAAMAATAAPAATAADAPTSAPAASGDAVTVSYTYPSFVPVKDVQEVADTINAQLKAKGSNITLKLEPIDGGSYDEKRKLAFAAGEKCDIVFTAPWINNYYVNIAQGNLLPLDDLLTTNAPNTYASMSPEAWDATRVNGKIYGVLNQQPWTRVVGPRVRKDLADKYKLDLTNVNAFEDLTPFLEALKNGEPTVTPIAKGSIYSAPFLGYDIVDGVSTDQGILGVRADDAALKVVNIAELPEFKKLIDLQAEWYNAGYYPSEDPGDQLTPNWQAGKYGLEFAVVNADSVGQLKSSYGTDFVAKGLGTPVLTTGGIIATMNGICASSDHPDAAMQVLEQLNTDKDIYNTMVYGIEGKHYTFVDQAKGIVGQPEGVTSATNGYNPNTPWMFGNLFNSYYNDPGIVGAWPESIKINESAIPSQALGFSFDPANVSTELAQVQAVQKQYGEPLVAGRVDPATGIPEYIQKLKDAGVDKLIAEIQSQLDTWKASK